MKTLIAVLLVAQTAAAAFRPLPALDTSKVRPSMFTDAELDLPFYLVHFPRLANAVVEEGPDRGFIRLSVWRALKDNQPYNARIMENILPLAWFYTQRRPWNVYYGSPGVRDRLEAALDFWVRIQAPSGAFSEYGPQKWNLAATAFATKFMGQTLRLLENGPPVDAALLDRVKAAQRKAILFVLTDKEFFEHGRNFSNQYTNVWVGALAWLSQRDDPEMRKLLEARIAQTPETFQSPAGYFYEARGADWSYNFGTHHSNLAGAYFYTKGTPLGKHFIDEERKFIDWVSYNAVPHGGEWLLNRAIETRQQEDRVSFDRRIPLTEHVPLARALVATREEKQREIAERRRELNRTWPAVGSLPVGEFTAYSPYIFLHREQEQYWPAEAEKKAAIAKMPVHARTEFIHQRMDSRFPVVFTFVRRPLYYAIFNSGDRLTPQQRYGLGLVWTPASGVLLQSQSRSDTGAWGTRPEGAKQVYEAADVRASFSTGDPQPGIRDLTAADLTVRYPLGTQGRKQLVFARDAIHVTVDHPGAFVEQLPAFAEGLLVEPRPTPAAAAEGPVRVLHLAGKDRLTYTIRFAR